MPPSALLPRLALATGLALGLAACGGGADSGGTTLPTGGRDALPSTQADLDTQNALAVGQHLAKALRGDATGGVTGPAAAARSHALASRQAGKRGLVSPLLLARQALFSAGPKLPTTRKQVSTASITQLSCPGGGNMTVTVDDQDGSGLISSGDTITTQFSNCAIAVGEPAMNGSFELSLVQVQLNLLGQPVSLEANARYTDFRIPGEGSINGGVKLWLVVEDAQERFRVSYQDARLVLPDGSSQTLAYDLYGQQSDTSLSLELSGALSVGTQRYAVRSVAPFSAGADGVMRSGTSQMRDAAGDVLQLQAQSTGRYDLSLSSASGQALWSSLGLGW